MTAGLAAIALTALTTAALGSLHCIGMCGPLVAAGCSYGGRVNRGATIGYFGGRLVAYATVGAIFGQVGQHAAHILPLSAVQTAGSAVVAIYAVYRGVAILWRARRPSDDLISLGGQRSSFVATILPKRGLGLGLVTGILPCGLLLVGWGLAAATAHPLHGAMVMAIFSIASAPALVAPLVAQRFAQARLARLPPWVFSLGWWALAAWLGLRPLLTAAHAHH